MSPIEGPNQQSNIPTDPNLYGSNTTNAPSTSTTPAGDLGWSKAGLSGVSAGGAASNQQGRIDTRSAPPHLDAPNIPPGDYASAQAALDGLKSGGLIDGAGTLPGGVNMLDLVKLMTESNQKIRDSNSSQRLTNLQTKLASIHKEIGDMKTAAVVGFVGTIAASGIGLAGAGASAGVMMKPPSSITTPNPTTGAIGAAKAFSNEAIEASRLVGQGSQAISQMAGGTGEFFKNFQEMDQKSEQANQAKADVGMESSKEMQQKAEEMISASLDILKSFVSNQQETTQNIISKI